MVFEKLGESLRGTLDKLTKSVFVDSRLVDELVRDIQRALLQADVNVKLVFKLSERMRERALKEETAAAVSRKDHLVTIVYEELAGLLGGEAKQIAADSAQTRIMLVGLFGSGKTTTAGKLAKYFTKRGKRVAMVQLDVWRPAAYEQLQQVGKQAGAKVFGNPAEKDPVSIYRTYEHEMSRFDVVIVDTAGRDALSDELIGELKRVSHIVSPAETLLVLSADVGQTAEKQATAFHEATEVTGVVITKLDGTAKGGGALSACAVSGAPVKMIGTGERIDDMETFDPKGFVGRLLGMGDIKGLLEKVHEAVSEEEAQDLGKKFLKGEFNLLDMYEQMQAMKKMGPLTKIMEMIPGMGKLKIPKEMLEVQEGKLKKWKHAMDSMTKGELEEPEHIDGQRVERIAHGSGLTTTDVRDLIKQHKQTRRMMKQFRSPKQMEQMMKRMGSGLPGMQRN